ncbi:MAG: hypothetical protein OXC11_00720 [Rhodospirillales bacterium]|nr:hypothetical protein [Rhodospirillales bacterium]
MPPPAVWMRYRGHQNRLTWHKSQCTWPPDWTTGDKVRGICGKWGRVTALTSIEPPRNRQCSVCGTTEQTDT